MLTDQDMVEVAQGIMKGLSSNFDEVILGQMWGNAIDWTNSVDKEDAKKQFIDGFIKGLIDGANGKRKICIHKPIELFADDTLKSKSREGFFGTCSVSFH